MMFAIVIWSLTTFCSVKRVSRLLTSVLLQAQGKKWYLHEEQNFIIHPSGVTISHSMARQMTFTQWESSFSWCWLQEYPSPIKNAISIKWLKPKSTEIFGKRKQVISNYLLRSRNWSSACLRTTQKKGTRWIKFMPTHGFKAKTQLTKSKKFRQSLLNVFRIFVTNRKREKETKKRWEKQIKESITLEETTQTKRKRSSVNLGVRWRLLITKTGPSSPRPNSSTVLLKQMRNVIKLSPKFSS